MSGMAKAVVPKGKSQGTHIGRLASVHASGSFSIKTKSGMVSSNYTIGDAVSL